MKQMQKQVQEYVQKEIQKQGQQQIYVGIVGTAAVAQKQIARFEALGIKTSWVTCSKVRSRTFTLDLQSLSDRTCWLVFTSANGVHMFMEQLKECGYSIERLQAEKNFKYAVIGSATGEMLQRYGFQVSLCPDVFTSEELAKALASSASINDCIVLLRSSIGSSILPRILKEHGYEVLDIATYDLELVASEKKELLDVSYITFSSASGVELYMQQHHKLPPNAKAVCIGPITAKALESYTKEYLIAKEITVDGLVQSILEDINK